MNIFSRKPKVVLDEFCRDFYDRNILHSIIEGIPAGSVFCDAVKQCVVDVDPTFSRVDTDVFEFELTALRFELFGLAWLHQFGDKRVAEQSDFTRAYLDQEDGLDIWEAMDSYNQAIARSSRHGLTPDTGKGQAGLVFINNIRLNMAEAWFAKGYEAKSVGRAVNRLLSEVPWKDGITREYLMLALCQQLDCEVNDDAQIQLISTVIGLYNGTREALQEVKIVA